MSKPNTKHATVVPKRRPTTRGKPSSRARAVDKDDDDDDDDDSELQVDEELTLFVRSAPLSADHMLVVALTHSGDAIVQDRTSTEARKAPVKLSSSIMSACERWARTEGRSVKFRATWLRGDKVLAAHQWQCGEGQDPTELDGTVESFLMQQQRFAEAQHRLHLEGFEMVQESWKGLLTLANKRIEALERDNAELRDRLRKVDDVGSEIAVASAQAEIEQRGKTLQLVETRLLPIAQALMIKHMETSAEPSAAATAADGKRD